MNGPDLANHCYDEWTRRLIRRSVGRYAGRGVDRADLEQIAALAVLESARPRGVAWLTHVYRVASRAAWYAVRKERRRKADPLPIRDEDMPASLIHRDAEPSDWVYRMMATLPYGESRAIELTLALGGGDFRSKSDVAWMMGTPTTSVCRRYRNGLARLRAS